MLNVFSQWGLHKPVVPQGEVVTRSGHGRFAWGESRRSGLLQRTAPHHDQFMRRAAEKDAESPKPEQPSAGSKLGGTPEETKASAASGKAENPSSKPEKPKVIPQGLSFQRLYESQGLVYDIEHDRCLEIDKDSLRMLVRPDGAIQHLGRVPLAGRKPSEGKMLYYVADSSKPHYFSFIAKQVSPVSRFGPVGLVIAFDGLPPTGKTSQLNLIL